MKSVDRLLVNLKIIASLPEFCKLKRNKVGCLEIDEPKYFSFLIRFLNGDSRDTTITDIDNVVNLSIDHCKEIVNSRYFSRPKQDIAQSFVFDKLEEEYESKRSTLEAIHQELKKIPNGLENLQKTYCNDRMSVAKIETIISKVNDQIYVIENIFTKQEKKMKETNIGKDGFRKSENK